MTTSCFGAINGSLDFNFLVGIIWVFHSTPKSSAFFFFCGGVTATKNWAVGGGCFFSLVPPPKLPQRGVGAVFPWVFGHPQNSPKGSEHSLLRDPESFVWAGWKRFHLEAGNEHMMFVSQGKKGALGLLSCFLVCAWDHDEALVAQRLCFVGSEFFQTVANVDVYP